VINAITRQLPELAKNSSLPLSPQKTTKKTKLQCPAMMIMIWQKERAEANRQKARQAAKTEAKAKDRQSSGHFHPSIQPSNHPSIQPSI